MDSNLGTPGGLWIIEHVRMKTRYGCHFNIIFLVFAKRRKANDLASKLSGKVACVILGLLAFGEVLFFAWLGLSPRGLGISPIF